MTLPCFDNDGPAKLLAILAIVVLGTVACGGKGQTEPANSAQQRGKVTFGRVCAMCHGLDAKGRPGLGKGLLDNAFSEGLSDAELVQFLKDGRSGSDELNETGVDMPPKGGDPTLSDEQLADLVAYLRTL